MPDLVAKRARLAELLKLDPTVDLTPNPAELLPTTLVPATTELAALVSRALAARPELTQADARPTRACEGFTFQRTVRPGYSQGPQAPARTPMLGGGYPGRRWNQPGCFCKEVLCHALSRPLVARLFRMAGRSVPAVLAGGRLVPLAAAKFTSNQRSL